MTPFIARKRQSATAVILLGVSCLIGACSSAPREEPTASISQPSSQVGSATPLPPIIHAPATVVSTQPAPQPDFGPVAYAPRQLSYAPRAKACTCPAPQRYDVTASIPRGRPAPPPPRQPPKMQFLVHTIEPQETLYSISRRYRTTVSDLATVNRMAENSRLRQGELLVVPTALH